MDTLAYIILKIIQNPNIVTALDTQLIGVKSCTRNLHRLPNKEGIVQLKQISLKSYRQKILDTIEVFSWYRNGTI